MTVLAFIVRNRMWVAIAILVAGLTVQALTISRLNADKRALEADKRTMKAASTLQVATYRAAYEKAVATAYADKIAKEKQHEAARQSSAAAYADLAGQYRATVLRLAAAAHPRGGAKPDLPGPAESAGLLAPTPEGAFFFITADDALICADNTAYAQAAFEWVAAQ